MKPSPRCTVLLLISTLLGAVDNTRAPLDLMNSAVVHPSQSISSQLKGLPVVEPHIAAHPNSPNHLLVAAMIVTDVNNPYESSRLTSFVSQDGGLSWRETLHDWWGYDPWVAILPNGQTAMSWIGSKQSFQHKFPICFFSSSDGGLSWSDEVQILDGNYDGTKIVALGSTFYFTSVRFRPDMGADVVLYRRQNEQPFEQVAVVDGKGKRLNFCEPAVQTDGTVLVPASDFMRKIWVQRYDPKTKALSSAYNFSLNPGGAKGYMRMAADVGVSSKYKDRIYFVRATGSGAQSEGVWLNYSSDQGVTWSADKRIDLFEKAKASYALVASVAVNLVGDVCILWVDSQNDPLQKEFDTYIALSLDGGVHFQRPVRVTSKSWNPRTSANADVANKFPGGGHYVGITARRDESFQIVWSEPRSGLFELQTCRVEVKSQGRDANN